MTPCSSKSNPLVGALSSYASPALNWSSVTHGCQRWPVKCGFQRHGSFVYSKMDPKEKQRVIDYYTQMDEEFHPVVYHSSRSASPRQTRRVSLKQEPQMAEKREPNSAEKQGHCIASPPRQSEKAAHVASSPQMMPTASSPIEWFDPNEESPPQQPATTSAQKGTPPRSAKE